MGSLDDDDDPIRMVDLVVVGEVEENVDDVLAIIGTGFHAMLHTLRNNGQW